MYKDPHQESGQRNISYIQDIRRNVLPKLIEICMETPCFFFFFCFVLFCVFFCFCFFFVVVVVVFECVCGLPHNLFVILKITIDYMNRLCGSPVFVCHWTKFIYQKE